MSAPCPTCQAVICSDTADDALYSIESALFPFVFNCPPGFDCGRSTGFKMICCGTLFSVDFPPGASADEKTTLIQGVVNQCTVQLAACNQNPGCLNPPCDPPPPTTDLFYNRDATCEVKCPDGTSFFYTVVAGTFADLTQEGADQKALDYACQQVVLRRVCINSFTTCLCVGSAFSQTITHTGGLPPIILTVVSGALPTGLTMSLAGVIGGTPTVAGNYSFSVKAQTADGGFVVKPFHISVMQITSTTPPAYAIGTPYTYQLTGAGGSGNYQWSIRSGALPTGVTMNDSGLISGTPTAAGTNPVVFRLVDLNCEAAQESVFPPAIRMSTQSTTKIATILGYPEYIPSIPPKRYRTITWAGTSEQVSRPLLGGVQSSNAKYEYSGFGQIDFAGRVVSSYSKNLSTPCPESSFTPSIQSTPNFGVNQLQGYCWAPDPRSCPICQVIPVFKADVSTNMIFDEPYGLLGVGNDFRDLTSTTLVNNNQQGAFLGLAFEGANGVTNFPLAALTREGLSPAIAIEATHNYSATLSDEYTDADALAHALVIVSNGATSENRPRTTGFVSRFTSVIFTLTMNNLIIGKDYLVTVQFRDLHFHLTTRTYGVNATDTTHSITDVVPTPSAGNQFTVMNPTIAFVP